MAAPVKKGSWIDPSKKAGSILDYILEDTSEETIEEKKAASPVEVELRKQPLVISESDRSQSRVLFVTADLGVLDSDSLQQRHFTDLGDVFSEVHVLVLCKPSQARRGTQRLGKNTWIYTTSVKHNFQQVFTALAVAKSQLCFSDGFRPDIVVALDPFESGLCGMLIAEKYDREFQVHIMEQYLTPEFKKRKGNGWRLRLAAYVLKRTQSVRVATEAIKARIVKKFPHLKDIAVLPRHFDVHSILNAAEGEVKKDLFPQYGFVILFVGKFDHESTLFRALDASRSALASRSIVFLALGDGPFRSEFQKRAEILGVQEQVLFKKDDAQLLAYLHSADILLCTDTTQESDEVVIKAAAAGLPILAAKTPLRTDLFVDGESAFLCEKEDTTGFSQKLMKFLNTNALRAQFSDNAKYVIQSRLHEDPSAYKLAYRDSIEGVFADLEEK